MDKSGSLDLVGIISQYVRLTPEGPSHHLGKCPFCDAKEDSLILSQDTQYWHCLSCGANGDRYDFVARSENIGRAQAILLVGHHANSGEPFPHARFRPGEPAAAAAPPPKAPPPPPPPAPKPEAARAPAPGGAPEPAVTVPFPEFKNIIPGYQGAALLDQAFRAIVRDTESSFSADLADIGESLAPVLEHAGAALAKWGMAGNGPATLTLASEELAFLVHKFGAAGKARLLVVRLANPSDVPVARRIVASVSARLG